MIKEARQNPFDVVNLVKNNFKDLQKFVDTVINTIKSQISQGSWIRISNENPGHAKEKNTQSSRRLDNLRSNKERKYPGYLFIPDTSPGM